MLRQYIKLNDSARFYANNNLFQTREDILDIISRFRRFGELRSKELILKVELRNRIGELVNSIKRFEKLLPIEYRKFSFYEEAKEEISLQLKQPEQGFIQETVQPRIQQLQKSEVKKMPPTMPKTIQERRKPKRTSLKEEIEDIRRRLELLKASLGIPEIKELD